MEAVVLYAKGKVKVMDMPVPAIGDDDILIEVKAAGICGGDIHHYKGEHDGGNYPIILGHEFAGIIAEKGKNVTDYWSVGDRVVSENTGGVCGRCTSCTTGNFVTCPEREIIGMTMNGGFAEYVRIPGEILKIYPSCLFKVPEEISFEEASVLEPAANAYKSVIQEGKMTAGENIVVFGPGPLGLLSVQMAKIAGAANIVLVGMSRHEKSRAPIGKKLGATHWMESDGDYDVVDRIADTLGRDGVSVVIDAVGDPSILEMAMRIVRTEGIINRVGMNSNPLNFGIDLLTFKSITLRGHMGYNTKSWTSCISLAQKGILDLKSIISCSLPLSEFEKGINMILNREAAKVVLIP